MWPPQRFARFSLAVSALIFGGFGTVLLIAPETVSGMGVVLTSPAARTEIRAFYGGLELGLAGFFLMAATKRAWLPAGLAAQAVTLGGVAAARLVGMGVDGAFGASMLWLFVAELSGSLLGLWALVRLRGTELG